eukprot:5814869-Lingulodinium_polyedra.AAC.1
MRTGRPSAAAARASHARVFHARARARAPENWRARRARERATREPLRANGARRVLVARMT